MPAIRDALTGDEIAQEIGMRLRYRRLERNITIEALAKRSGVGRSAVGDIEAGRDVRLSSLIKVMRGLGVLSNLDAVFPDTLPTSGALTKRGGLRRRAQEKKSAKQPVRG